MTRPLFRPEVLEAKSAGKLGAVSLIQPLSVWVLSLAGLAAVLAILGLMIFGQFTRSSTVEGQLVPDLGLSTVFAPSNGVAGKLYVEEGTRVQKGTPLMTISAPRVTADGDDAVETIRSGLLTRRLNSERLALSDAQKVNAQFTGKSLELQQSELELRQIEGEIASRAEQVKIAQKILSRYEDIVDTKYISEIQVDQQRQSVLEASNAQQALERQAIKIRSEIFSQKQTLAEIAAEQSSLRARATNDLAVIDKELVEQDTEGELLIRSPVAGMVASRQIEPGLFMKAGQPLLSLLPAGSKLQAELLVPSKSVAFVEPGSRVILRYQAFPYQQFGRHEGRVIRISRSAMLPAEGETADTDAFYRVIVKLDSQRVMAYGKQEELRPGMKVDADILGRRQRVYEWILDPLYSLRGRMN